MADSSTPKLFGWTDLLILVGAVILLPAAIIERNWFFLGIGVAILAAVPIRVWVTRWLIRRGSQD